MPQEVEILCGLMLEPKTTEIANCKIFEGKINNRPVAVLQSGIGKVAALWAQPCSFNNSNPI